MRNAGMVVAAVFVLNLTLATLQPAVGQDAADKGADDRAAVVHRHVQTVEREDLKSICSTIVSPDEKFLYASAWKTATIVTYSRDVESGKLEYVDSLTDEEKLDGTTSLDISDDGKLAVASAFRSKAINLLTRDSDTGKLTVIDTVFDGDGGAAEEIEVEDLKVEAAELAVRAAVQEDAEPIVSGLSWAIDTRFSHGARYAYVANGKNGVAVFEVTAKPELKFVEHVLIDGENLLKVREVAVHPLHPLVYVASMTSGSVSVFDQNPMNGALTFKQAIWDGQDDVEGIDGVHGLTCSADGKFLFVTSGRFSGCSSIGCYRIDDEGELLLVNELINDETEGFTGFVGGNNIEASPDGLSVYSPGTKSGVVAACIKDSETGEIAFQEFLQTEDGETDLNMAAGLTVSNDGKFIYVGSEADGKVFVFSREAG